jgi:hypothetical protein
MLRIHYSLSHNELTGFGDYLKVAIVSVVMVSVIAMSSYAYYAHATATTLTVTVQSVLTFALVTENLGNLTPSTPVFGTTTMQVDTNDTDGWNVTLACDERTTDASSVVTNQCGDLDTDTTVELPDPVTTATWVIAAATATTTAGSAAAITSGDDFLFFRVESASGTDPFRSTAWWGTSDVNFNGSQLWAGVPSTTNASRIGNAGAGSYRSAQHANAVSYYLDVASTQQTGAYSVPLTYTATAN